MPQDLTDDKSTLVQVMAWCRQATSRYLSQCWPRSMSPYGVTGPQWVDNLWPTTTLSSGNQAVSIDTCHFTTLLQDHHGDSFKVCHREPRRFLAYEFVRNITVTSWWALWRLTSQASRFLTQPSVQVQIKENIKAPRHWPLWGECTGDRWIPRTKGQ